MRTTNTTKRRRGIASVELALTLPILVLMVMAVIEGGNVFYSWLTVQKAAQIGARYAATGRGDGEGTRLTQIIKATEAGLASLDNANAEIKVRSWPDVTAEGDGIENYPGAPCQLAEVAVIYHYSPLTPLIAQMLPESFPLYGFDRKVNEPWKPCE